MRIYYLMNDVYILENIHNRNSKLIHYYELKLILID